MSEEIEALRKEIAKLDRRLTATISLTSKAIGKLTGADAASLLADIESLADNGTHNTEKEV